MAKAEATASYKDFTFTAQGEGDNILEAQKAAVEAIDKKIDSVYGLSKGRRSYEFGQSLKNSVEFSRLTLTDWEDLLLETDVLNPNPSIEREE